MEADPEQDIQMPVWVERGGMLIRRDALNYNDPDHPYNWLKARGVHPEYYGYKRPDSCPHCGLPLDDVSEL